MTGLPPMAAPNSLIVKLAARPDFTKVDAMPRGAARKQAAFDAITKTATDSQKPLLAVVEKLKADGAITGYQTLVSPNAIIVTPAQGKAQVVADTMYAAQGVRQLYSNRDANVIPKGGKVPGLAPQGPVWGLDVVKKQTLDVAPPAERPYGLDLIGAPKAWERGAAGEGLVYGSIDTGVDVTHEAIANKYRGRAADGKLNHDYNWFDPSGASKTPIDENGHGTHTIGTVVGEGIGVVPKAKFISASGLVGSADGFLKSLQWMLAPTKIDGTTPDPKLAPDVVGMSWWTGRTDQDFFMENMQDLRHAGILPVKSAGNRGPGAGTISSPGQYPEVVATAAVDKDGKIASFSSRGPAPFPGGKTTPKPDIAAPGVDVISAGPGNKYVKMSGTSMAQPHMSGIALSMLSKMPTLSLDQLTTALKSSAVDKGAPGFDAEYGAGIANLPAALDAAAKLLTPAPKPTPPAPTPPAPKPALV